MHPVECEQCVTLHCVPAATAALSLSDYWDFDTRSQKEKKNTRREEEEPDEEDKQTDKQPSKQITKKTNKQKKTDKKNKNKNKKRKEKEKEKERKKNTSTAKKKERQRERNHSTFIEWKKTNPLACFYRRRCCVYHIGRSRRQNGGWLLKCRDCQPLRDPKQSLGQQEQ